MIPPTETAHYPTNEGLSLLLAAWAAFAGRNLNRKGTK
jgi:hypothetical protein